MAWKEIRVEMTPEDLVGSYMQGERDFRGIRLIQSPLAVEGNEIDLRGLCLRDINLSGADFHKADFTESDFTNANMVGASFTESCFKRAIIRDANMYSVNLNWSDLREVDFQGTTLSHVNAVEASFDRAKIRYIEYSILAEARFHEAWISKELICGFGNLIWRTTLPDGTIENGPYWGDF